MRSRKYYAPREIGTEKKTPTEEEIEKLQSTVNTSEYQVIEQLRKMPAQISLLDLFQSSKKHKNALIRVLNEIHIPETINKVQLGDFVGVILLKDQIAFSDEDFPGEGRVHNKALYIAIRCHGKEVPHVNRQRLSLQSLSPKHSNEFGDKLILHQDIKSNYPLVRWDVKGRSRRD